MKPADCFTGFLLVLLFFSTQAITEPPTVMDEKNSSADAPSLELLEFLGEFETEDGEWIDPEDHLAVGQWAEPDSRDQQPSSASQKDFCRPCGEHHLAVGQWAEPDSRDQQPSSASQKDFCRPCGKHPSTEEHHD